MVNKKLTNWFLMGIFMSKGIFMQIFKNFLILMMVIQVLVACSSRKEELLGGDDNAGLVQSQVRVDTNQDSDGDLVKDLDEKALGRNPFMADIPELKVRFLQNYSILLQYEKKDGGEKEDFLIDTKIGRDDPNFQYRVGDIFLRYDSFRSAAQIGRFSGHSWGEMKEHDLSWVKYPDIDPTFYARKVLEHKNRFSTDKFTIVNGVITVENSVRLQEFFGFKTIKNLELNFYYFDHETENYVLLKTEKIERHFNAGVNEVFEVKIEKFPMALVEENYLKKGEFIISEVSDFEIPELDTTYKKLMASVREKSIPVVYNTPLESSVQYVGLNGEKGRFVDILTNLFDSKFTIETNELKKINQFENNLPDFTYLKELQEQDKLGKWFVFTNKLNQHFLDYEFSAKDIISLSYITGNILARQSDEKIVGIHQAIDGGEDSKIYGVGNVTANSSIDIQLSPVKKWGLSFTSEDRNYHERPGSCGTNCVTGILTVDCFVKINHFKNYDEAFKFNQNFKGELENISLVINDNEYQISKLIADGKIKTIWKGENLHLIIDDPTKIQELPTFEENVMFLKLKTVTGKTFQGAYLHGASGPNQGVCPQLVANASYHWGVGGVYGGSIMMDAFNHFRGQGLPILPPKPYSQKFSISVMSVVNNMFN